MQGPGCFSFARQATAHCREAPQGKTIWRSERAEGAFVSTNAHLASTPEATRPVEHAGLIRERRLRRGKRWRPMGAIERRRADPTREPPSRRTATYGEPSRPWVAARAERAMTPTSGRHRMERAARASRRRAGSRASKCANVGRRPTPHRRPQGRRCIGPKPCRASDLCQDVFKGFSSANML